MLGDFSAREQTDLARLTSHSGVWALSAGTSGRIGRRTGNVFALSVGTGVAVLVAVIVVLSVLIDDRQESRRTAAYLAPGATPAVRSTTATAVPATAAPVLPATPAESAQPETSAQPEGADRGRTIADFEQGSERWTLTEAEGTVAATSLWASTGQRSLRALIDARAGGTAYLSTQAITTLPARGTLRAVVRSGRDSEMTVKLYVKSGPDWAWTDAGAVPLQKQSNIVSLNMAAVALPGDVREIGLQIRVPSDNSGKTSVYIDAVTVS